MNNINPSIKRRLSRDLSLTKSAKDYVDGIVNQKDYYILSEAITLLESEHPTHQSISLQTLMSCYHHRASSFRLGITGSPGVGKSTFIDSIARHFSDQQHGVGILAIDPSATDGKGSILGDKTRMEELVKDKKIFIRPSPSNRQLGGLNPHTYEAMILCEAAGIDRLLIETVGVGQSEVEVSQHVDATVLLVQPGGGDSLQGIKKGIIERADLIIIHKADGDAKQLAITSAKEFAEALHFRKKGKEVPIISYSSVTEEGKERVTAALEQLMAADPDQKAASRTKQEEQWLISKISEYLSALISKEVEVIWDECQTQSYESPFDQLSFLMNSLDISLKVKK